MPTWEEIKAGIFKGESGGDYDALFGFSNRPGGRFAGTKITDMTVNEAIDFANPRGEYANWVKNQIGRVATPMGGFQAVGSTLKQAKDWAGLSGDERMTPEVQDRIGQAILAKQGTGAWAGYRGPGKPGTGVTLNTTPRHVGGAGSAPGYFAAPEAAPAPEMAGATPQAPAAEAAPPATIQESLKQDLAKDEEDSVLSGLVASAAKKRQADAEAFAQFSQIQPSNLDVGGGGSGQAVAGAAALMQAILQKRRQGGIPGLSLMGVGTG
jgi:hypothetical protein